MVFDYVFFRCKVIIIMLLFVLFRLICWGVFIFMGMLLGKVGLYGYLGGVMDRWVEVIVDGYLKIFLRRIMF